MHQILGTDMLRLTGQNKTIAHQYEDLLAKIQPISLKRDLRIIISMRSSPCVTCYHKNVIDLYARTYTHVKQTALLII